MDKDLEKLPSGKTNGGCNTWQWNNEQDDRRMSSNGSSSKWLNSLFVTHYKCMILPSTLQYSLQFETNFI